MLLYITNLERLPPIDVTLKFLVTSRPYREIEVELARLATAIRLRGKDGVEAMSDAVTRVINEGILNLEMIFCVRSM